MIKARLGLIFKEEICRDTGCDFLLRNLIWGGLEEGEIDTTC